MSNYRIVKCSNGIVDSYHYIVQQKKFFGLYWGKIENYRLSTSRDTTASGEIEYRYKQFSSIEDAKTALKSITDVSLVDVVMG